MYNLIAKHRNAGSDYLNTAALERNGGNAEYFWTLQNNAGSIGFYDDGLYVETQGDDIPIPTSPCFGYGTYKLEVHHFLAPPYCLIEYWDSCLIERDYNSGGPTEKDLKTIFLEEVH